MSRLIDEPTFGADPEVFIKDVKSKKLVSAIGLIGGSKKRPRRMDNDIFVQEDNVLAEFNIPPVKTLKEFKTAIKNGISTIDGIIGDTLEVDISPYGFFDKEQLNSYKAKQFGCSADFNCWTGEQNQSPCSKDKTLRTAAGHLMLGYRKPRLDVSQDYAKAMDLFAGVPSTLMSDELPRRELYGKMGTVRYKVFGVEYRTLSNFWLASDERIEWAFEAQQKAIEFVNDYEEIDHQTYTIMDLAINNGVEKAAKYLIDQFKLSKVA